MKWTLALLLTCALGVGLAYVFRPQPRLQGASDEQVAQEHSALEQPIEPALEEAPAPTPTGAAAPSSASHTFTAPALAEKSASRESDWDSPEKRAQVDAARKAQAPQMEDFLQGELKLTDEEMATYKEMKSRHEKALIEKAQTTTGDNRRPAGMGRLMREQRREIREFLGTDRYARYEEFQRRQREELAIQFPELRDRFLGGRRDEGRRERR